MAAFLMFLVFLAPFVAHAQQSSIVINEIAWMGTPVASVEEKQWWRYEWLELYNAGDTVEMLDGWTVELYREKLDFFVSLKGSVAPHGYYVIGASDMISNVDLNYKNLGGKLNNSGQRIVLKNGLGEIVDEVDASKGWPGGDNKTKQTMERIEGALQAKAWQTSAELGGTPKAPNSFGVAIQTKSDLVVQEAGTKSDLAQGLVQGETEKDLAGSSSVSSSLDSRLSLTKDVQTPQQFESRIPIVNPVTLLAGFLALGSSVAVLLVKRRVLQV